MVIGITNICVKYINSSTLSNGEIFYKFKISFNFTNATKISGKVYGPLCNILYTFTDITVGNIIIKTKHFGYHKIKIVNSDKTCEKAKIKIKIKPIDGTSCCEDNNHNNHDNCSDSIENLEEYIINICTNICESYCFNSDLENLESCDIVDCPYCN